MARIELLNATGQVRCCNNYSKLPLPETPLRLESTAARPTSPSGPGISASPSGDRGAGVDVARARSSLILRKSSLFPEMFSLLVCVGNFAKSRCSAATSLSGFGVLEPQNRKIPCKIPC